MANVKTQLDFQITPQPDDTTCGPACLHSLYRFFGDELPLERVIDELPKRDDGGVLTVHLALHALARGYRTTIYTCNLQLFDPTWFDGGRELIRQRLEAQMKAKPDPKLHHATLAYMDYLDRGGALYMVDITADLLGSILDRGTPMIAGLSATWLYRVMRERPADDAPDDAAGEPVGHFVVVYGLNRKTRQVKIADPYRQVPFSNRHNYEVDVDRLIASILLGIVTYDVKLLILSPPTHT